MAGQETALAAEGLTLAWADGRVVVEDVSLEVMPRSIVALVGRSGTGKSTLFHGLAGLVAPVAGTVCSFGRDITATPGQVGYMLQKDLLLPQLTVLDNAALPLVIGGMSRARARERTEPLLGRFGLEASASLHPSQLSGGMRQRVALLRTHMAGRSVVLMDEPFSALDALTRRDLRGWFRDICAELGKSVLIVTHDVDEAIAMADRILVLAGDPAHGHPSSLVGEVALEGRPGLGDGDEVTPERLRARAEVLSLLG